MLLVCTTVSYFIEMYNSRIYPLHRFEFAKILTSESNFDKMASYGDHHWTPPKGHVDPNEDEYSTAVRETLEETGLKESDLNIMKNVSKTLLYNVKGKPKTVIYWLAELVNPEREIVLSEEHQALKWLGLKEACTLGHYQEMKELFEYCDANIKK